MASYGTAASGLPDLVKRRIRGQYGVGDEDGMGMEGGYGIPLEGGGFTPPEEGGFTGGQNPGEEFPGGPGLPPEAPPIEVPGGTMGGGQQPPPSGPPPPYAPPPTVPTGVSVGGSGPLSDAFQQALLAHLNQPIGASLNDPALAAQSQAYSVGQTRSRDQAREALAERLAAQGISDSGALDTGIAGLYQQQGENQAGFNAKLVGDELQRQRAEMIQYMQMAGNRLTSQEAQALQARIAELNAAIQQQGQVNQVNQYNSNMGWEQTQWQALQDWMAQNFVQNPG